MEQSVWEQRFHRLVENVNALCRIEICRRNDCCSVSNYSDTSWRVCGFCDDMLYCKHHLQYSSRFGCMVCCDHHDIFQDLGMRSNITFMMICTRIGTHKQIARYILHLAAPISPSKVPFFTSTEFRKLFDDIAWQAHCELLENKHIQY